MSEELTGQDLQLIWDVLIDHQACLHKMDITDSEVSNAAHRKRNTMDELSQKIERIIYKKYGGRK